MYQVIIHLDQENNIEKVMNNVLNLLEDMEEAREDVNIEVLANGSGVKPFQKSQVINNSTTQKLLVENVQLAVCQNSLDQLNLQAEDLVPEAIIVRSGVGELTRKQNRGWAYIKP